MRINLDATGHLPTVRHPFQRNLPRRPPEICFRGSTAPRVSVRRRDTQGAPAETRAIESSPTPMPTTKRAWWAARKTHALPKAKRAPQNSTIRIIGEPTTPNGAAVLAEEDKDQFQWWALGLVSARPVEQRGADHGIDDKILFATTRSPQAGADHHANQRRQDRRERRAGFARRARPRKAAIGLDLPSTATATDAAEAASAGFYEHKMNRQKFPRLQLRTVRESMEGKAIERPSNVAATDETFKKAPKAKTKETEQTGLNL